MAIAQTPEQKKAAYESKQEAKTIIEGDTGSGRIVRRKRGILNGTESKLKVGNLLDGYHMHFMNDTGNRISDAQEAGYEFVHPKEVGGMANNNVTSRNTDLSEDKIRILVGTTNEGPLYAYLLKIRQDWYDEDQSDLEKRNDLVDNAIRNGQNAKSGTSSEGFYTPQGGISLKRN